MTIQLFSAQLRAALDAELSETDLFKDELIKVGQALNAVRDSIRELKNFTLKYKFKDESEEIHFFKTAKPEFISLYTFYRKVFALRLFDSFRDEKARHQNYEAVLKKLSRYAVKHQVLYEYAITGSADLDRHYFLRSADSERLINHDEKFSTGFDVRLGKLLGNDRLREHVLLLMSKETSETHSGKVAWTASKASLIELLYACHAAKVFNDGSADIKEIATAFESAFRISLGNYYRVFQDIRMRKANSTIFLDQLRDKLQQQINSSLE